MHVIGIGASLVAAAQSIWIGKFGAEGPLPPPWRVVPLKRTIPPTRYRLTTIDGVPAVEAVANSSVALLARPVAVDLGRTPILCWKWWIEAPVDGADMTRRSGDDYAARVYVAFDMPESALSLGTRVKLALARRIFGNEVPDAALNYVWDNRHRVGTWRKSPYTDRAQLIVQESGSAAARRWVAERVDVARDFTRAFAGKPGTPIQVAIATDTDNTRSTARAAFADLRFVGLGEPC